MSIFLGKNELKILKILNKEWKDYRDISKETGLNIPEVLRSLHWLNKKELVEIKEIEKEYIVLGNNGKKYKEKGLPEFRVYNYLKNVKEDNLENVRKKLDLDSNEINISLGILKKKGAIDIVKRDDKIILKFLKEVDFPENEFLKKFEEIEYDKLSENEKKIIVDLLKRKDILEKRKIKIYFARITEKGGKIKKEIREEEIIEVLTSNMITNREYVGKTFKEFDLSLKIKPARFGKKHPYLKYLEYVRKYLLSLGFEEMEYKIVISHFWNMDSLFLPQDHPAGELSLADFFIVKNPKYIEDFNPEIYEKVKKTHLKYFRIWNDSVAKRAVLISHITALSALTLRNVKIPGKYFAIERVFRHDTIDAKHHIEFRQLEGFVADENISFRDLLGLLKDITEVLANAKEVKFYPAYFPFTEPSVEVYVKHPKLGWIEVGGAGMFREEILKNFGIEVPVIAWGLGIDRMAMIYLGIDDIRMLYTKDLKWLKEKEVPFV